MRLKGRQARFLLLVLGGWSLARLAATWPAGEAPVLQAEAAVDREPVPRTSHRPATVARPSQQIGPPAVAEARTATMTRDPFLRPTRLDPGSTMEPDYGSEPDGQGVQIAGPRIKSGVTDLGTAGGISFSPSSPSSPPLGLPAPGAASGRRIEAQAYLFVRPGSGRALSSGSALGGSQAAARLAVPIDDAGRIAVAARLYAPLKSAGAETALGVDLRPARNVPFRVSVERRQRLDHAGRSAWSAYTAGGLYREVAGVRLDGYAQAGVVGLRARDLFADGAIRAERMLPIGPMQAGIGAGIWGAAQPGAERVDAGPRASVRLSVSGHALSLAVGGRFRLTGRARPGSGAALTLAADL